jgi:DNA polymerase III epsilon subunit-like protein
MDTETGGLKKTETILTIYMGIVDPKDLTIKDEIYLQIKPDNGEYVYSEEALKVNGIDLIKHDKVAITESKAAADILNFFKKNKVGTSTLTPLGHNVKFDIEFINNKLIPSHIWNEYVEQNTCDTMEMGKKLKEFGRLPMALSNSLGSYAEYFFIKTVGLHDARIDCYTTLKVYKKLIEVSK